MKERIAKLRKQLEVEKLPLCIDKARLITESYRQTEGEPTIIRRAKAQANVLDHILIFVEDQELIVGNTASKPMGVEADFWYDNWSDEEIDWLKKEGSCNISDGDASEIEKISKYWRGKTFGATIGQYLDEEKLWPFAQTGMIIPPWESKDKWSAGWARSGLSFGPLSGVILDYERVLTQGLESTIKEAEDALQNLKRRSDDDAKKSDFLKAVIISHMAICRFADRFADLASAMAEKETDSKRKSELNRIAKACRWVPYHPARNFHEAIQAYWFIFLTAGGVLLCALGRFDQFMYPFYRKDRESGGITDDEAIELLACFRIKCMQINITSTGVNQEKRAGKAKWQNMVIGGQLADGKDATNPLTYLVLDAIKACPTPHHTVSLRIHDNTPEALILKALDVARTGIGMPSFFGDKSEIDYLTGKGVSLAKARNYAFAGCMEANIPGESRFLTGLMFIVPLVFDVFMHNGVEPATGKQIGPKTGKFEDFKSYEELWEAWKTHLAYFMDLLGQYDNVFIKSYGKLFPSPDVSGLMKDGIVAGCDIYNRAMTFENGACMIPVGIINVVDSLAAIKKVVFEDRKVSLKELKMALEANWHGDGYEEMRTLFIKAPKYGNGNEYVDEIARDMYRFFADTTNSIDGAFGVKHKPGAISITSQWPGGALTGATPDGRYAGEVLADGTVSPAQGRDTHGPTAVIHSAAKIDQAQYQSTLLNMKFHPTALKTEDDLKKLSSLIRSYFQMGGKQMQLNVVDKERLLAAQKEPENYKNLIVRVAGYSAYFTELGTPIQDDVIRRMEHRLS